MEPQYKQWLDEIEALRSQLQQAQRDREAEQTKATHWRHLYNTEAQQRRSEADRAKETIAALEAQIAALKTAPPVEEEARSTAESQIADIPDDRLRAELVDRQARLDRLCQERDRLAEELAAERTAHDRTRSDLTTALGDTVERLVGRKPPRSPSLEPQTESTSPPEKEEPAALPPSNLDLTFLDRLSPPNGSHPPE